eukprot:CAMPEP_0184872842 /NCGR_PEP_ID=MMETSP0580-20130426/41515_1 /TAXON_ID=1118495 /ORGANISM="Dactyliosolen fragilissimus" /LENGTH=968 /DNA_ID=CAMNT_0027375689 /DNA_START=1061 /DNA_END=3967 /DNA_ORIENTATION=-
MKMNQIDILSCQSPKFIPVIEHIQEAAKYQIQLEAYKAAQLEQIIENEQYALITKTWRSVSQGLELILASLIKAAEEDENFDDEIQNFLSDIINFLEDFELKPRKNERVDQVSLIAENQKIESLEISETEDHIHSDDASTTPELWFFNDLFGGILSKDRNSCPTCEGEVQNQSSVQTIDKEDFANDSYQRIYNLLQIIMRAVIITRTACSDQPNLQMILSMVHEILIFTRTTIKVQQKNMSKASVEAWRRTFEEFVEIFLPLKERMTKIGKGISHRMEVHGNIAKVRILKFVDIIIKDDILLDLIEKGEYAKCIHRLEVAAVDAQLIDKESCEEYHKTALFLLQSMPQRHEKSQAATERNKAKLTHFAKLVKLFASPHQNMLKLLTHDDILELLEKILVRVFHKEKDSWKVLNIYAFNFRTFWHLRILKNMSICSRLWSLVLDAADEEFCWAISRMPESTRDFVGPISKLFSLGVSHFHQMHESDCIQQRDWLEFLMDNEAVNIIQQLDKTLMLSISNFCKDVKDMMYILPYYSSIDQDILNLIDEVELDKILKEAAQAIVDKRKFVEFVRGKSVVAISRFLEYLPKMSIPIEKRDIGEGWVITCRSKLGDDLTLSSVSVNKENLVCQVLGSDNVLSHGFCDEQPDDQICLNYSINNPISFCSDDNGSIEVSILDHIGELIKNAQTYGCWNYETDVSSPKSSTDPKGSCMQGVPMSEVLRCAIDLWKNMDIDDDELLEIAIRDISYHIEQQKEIESDEKPHVVDKNWEKNSSHICERHRKAFESQEDYETNLSPSSCALRTQRFNPRVDPTVLYLELNDLTCLLDEFSFRIEPIKQMSIFDPVFEGIGNLAIKNASIKLRIECRKERIHKLEEEVTVPVLQLKDFEVGLEKVKFKLQETGVDWILNKVLSNFSTNITDLVKLNLKEQLLLSINGALENLNSYIEVNPDLMLKILGISLDDLEEVIAWV